MIDKIIYGDSIKILDLFPDEYFHAIISDIPYGISYDEWDILHNNTNSALGGSTIAQRNGGNIFKRRGKPLNGWSEADKNIPLEYQQWCASWTYKWLRVLKPGSSCFVFAGRRLAHRCIVAMEDNGFTFKDMLAWEKNTAPHRAQRVSEIYLRRGDFLDADIWRGWRVANLRPLFEPILWFQKPYKLGGTIADNILQYEVGAWNENAFNGIPNSNIVTIPYMKSDRGLHETQKPLKLIEFLISLVTKKNMIILDPFAGSGTTCLAAKNLCRHYVGIEKKDEYFKIASNRLQQPTETKIFAENS